MARLPFSPGFVRLVVAALMIAASLQYAIAADPIDSMAELSHALKACLAAPAFKARPGIAFSARMSFRRNGELLGAPFVFFQSPNVSERERQSYRAAVEQAIAHCTPLPFTTQFGNAMAGHPITIHLIVVGGRGIML